MVKFESKFKPQKMACKERYAGVTIANGKAYATNGKAMAVVPVEGEDCTVSLKAIEAAAKVAKSLKHSDVFIDVEGAVATLADGSIMPEQACTTMPTVEVMHKVLNRETSANMYSFGLDARLLLQLAEAIGSAPNAKDAAFVKLTIDLDSPLESIRVEPNVPNGALGVIMPCRIK